MNFVGTIHPVERLKVSVVPFDLLNGWDVCLNARFLEFPLLKPHPKALFVHSFPPSEASAVGRHIAGLIRAFAALNLFAAAVALINLVLGSNYMYLSAPPGGTLSPFFVGWRPWYIVVLAFVALATFLAVYAPFALAARELARREPKR